MDVLFETTVEGLGYVKLIMVVEDGQWFVKDALKIIEGCINKTSMMLLWCIKGTL